MWSRLWNKEPAKLNEKPTVKNNAVEENDTESPKDILANLQNDINHLQEKIQQRLTYWHEKKKAVLQALPEFTPEETPKNQMFLEQFKNFFTALKSLVETPNQYIQELLNQKKSHIDDLCRDLFAECNELPGPDEEKNNKIRLQLCEKSIADLNELSAILALINTEIEYCLQTKHVAYDLIVWIAQLIINGLLRIHAPDIQLENEKLDRARLYNEIQTIIAEVYKVIDSGQAAEEKAGNKIENREEIKKPPAEEKPYFAIRGCSMM